MVNPPHVLIPVHNRRTLSLACLAALRANGDLAACRVIVVDDGSQDGTGGAVAAEFPDVILLRGDGHLYWTGAIALAMREAAARGPGPVLWLNDDCRPRPGALATLWTLLGQNPDMIAGPRCVDATTGATVPTGFVGRRTFSAAAGERRAVEGLSGFCVGVGAGAAAKLGEPDALNFPHYAGDTAYTLRANRAGHPVVLLGDAVVELVDYGSGPATLESLVQKELSFSENWRRIFAAPNSPYRMPTMFALQRLKYGPITGRALALLRGAGWLGRMWWAKTRV
jgi:GT2 family glycosyltransferase